MDHLKDKSFYNIKENNFSANNKKIFHKQNEDASFSEKNRNFSQVTLDALGHGKSQNFKLLESTKRKRKESLPRV